MAASSINLKHLPRLLHTSSIRPMAASSLNLKHLSRLLHTSLLRPMAASSLDLKQLPRLLHTSSLRPMTIRATSGYFPSDAEKTFYELFHVEREPEPTSEKPNLPPFVYHAVEARGREDGFDICLFMAGVSKENVKFWIERDEMIAEGKKENEYEDDEDDVIRYRMSRPPTEVFNLDATKAEIKNGILRVFVPKKKQDVFVPMEG